MATFMSAIGSNGYLIKNFCFRNEFVNLIMLIRQNILSQLKKAAVIAIGLVLFLVEIAAAQRPVKDYSNEVNGDQYLDRHISLNNNSNIYSFQTNYTLNGETGLAAPGTGFAVYGLYTPNANTMPQCYPGSEFPPNAPLKITLFYPGGGASLLRSSIPQSE